MGVGAGNGSASPPSWGHLATEGGTSTGAAMSVVARREPSSASSSCCSCGGGHCVNIYVNNNVQGVTNSVLVGSKVVMRDPGARVSSRHRQPRRDGRRRREGKRSSRQQQKPKTTTTKIGVVVVSLLFVAAAAAVLCLRLFVRGSR